MGGKKRKDLQLVAGHRAALIYSSWSSLHWTFLVGQNYHSSLSSNSALSNSAPSAAGKGARGLKPTMSTLCQLGIPPHKGNLSCMIKAA